MDRKQLLECFEALKIIPLRHDDILVFKTKAVISCDTSVRLKDFIRSELAIENRILILSEDLDVEVIRNDTDDFRISV